MRRYSVSTPAILFAIVLAVATQAAAQSPSPAGPPWREAVSALLARRAAAVGAGDEPAFRATMAGAPEAFVIDRLRSMRALRSLPLASYALELEPDGFDDLAPALAGRPQGDEVHVVQATERIAFRGYDAAPTADDVFLTVVRRGAAWSIVSDEGLDDLDLRSSRNLWDFGSVATVERAGALVMFHPKDRSQATAIAQAASAAIRDVRSRWPFDWPARAVVIVPGTTGELERILQTTFDLGPFVAFAGSSVDRSGGGFRFTGHRIYVQPETFFDYGASFRAETLAHELLHVATREVSGPFVPSWLDEGVAQFYGETRAPRRSELRTQVRADRFPGRLPLDHEFTLDPTIEASYQSSYEFMDFLRDRFGRPAGARLYRALGTKNPVSYGTWRYHLDRAARSAFGAPFRTLERAWADVVTGRYS